MKWKHQCVVGIGGGCDLGSLVVEDSRTSWTCNVWVFGHCTIRFEGQGEASLGGQGVGGLVGH